MRLFDWLLVDFKKLIVFKFHLQTAPIKSTKKSAKIVWLLGVFLERFSTLRYKSSLDYILHAVLAGG